MFLGLIAKYDQFYVVGLKMHYWTSLLSAIFNFLWFLVKRIAIQKRAHKLLKLSHLLILLMKIKNHGAIFNVQ